jgi:hypothetical protein
MTSPTTPIAAKDTPAYAHIEALVKARLGRQLNAVQFSNKMMAQYFADVDGRDVYGRLAREAAKQFFIDPPSDLVKRPVVLTDYYRQATAHIDELKFALKSLRVGTNRLPSFLFLAKNVMTIPDVAKQVSQNLLTKDADNPLFNQGLVAVLEKHYQRSFHSVSELSKLSQRIFNAAGKIAKIPVAESPEPPKTSSQLSLHQTPEMMSLINRSTYSLGRSVMSIEDIVQHAHDNKLAVAALTDVNSLAGVPKFLSTCERKGIHGVAGLTLLVKDQGRFCGELVVLGKGVGGYNALKALELEGAVFESEFKPDAGIELSRLLSGELEPHFAHCMAIDGFPGSVGEHLLHKELGKQLDAQKVADIYLNNTQEPWQLKQQFGSDDYVIAKTPLSPSVIAAAFTPPLAKGLASGQKGAVLTTIAHGKDHRQLNAAKQWFKVSAAKELDSKGLSPTAIDEWINKAFAHRHLVAPEGGMADQSVFISPQVFVDKCPVPPVFSSTPIMEPLRKGSVDNRSAQSSSARFSAYLKPKWDAFLATLSDAEKSTYIDRYEQEMSQVCPDEGDGYTAYFLNICAIKNLANLMNIGVMMRGSGVSSLLLHVLDFTPIDPVANGLLFERFIDPGRVSEPDVDLEFSLPKAIRRAMKEAFPGQVATLSNCGGRSAAKTLLLAAYEGAVSFGGYSDEQKLALSNAKDTLLSSVKEKVKNVPAERLDDWKSRNDVAVKGASNAQRLLIEDASALNKGLSSYVVSPATVIVIPDGIETRFNTRPGKHADELPELLIDKNMIPDTGEIKYDLLSNRIFERVHNARRLLDISGYATIAHEDPAIAAVFGTESLFDLTQLGQWTGQKLAKRMKPRTFNEISALNAVIREGDDDKTVTAFLRGRSDPASITVDPLMAGVLSDTFGSMLYEEQLMVIMRDVAGFTWEEADTFRSGLKKGKPVVDEYRDTFIEKIIAHQPQRQLTHESADLLYAPFLAKKDRFVFSKAHSLAYTHLCLEQCELKCYFPGTYNAELFLGSDSDKRDDKFLTKLVNEWKSLKFVGEQQGLPAQNASHFLDAIEKILIRENLNPDSEYAYNLEDISRLITLSVNHGDFDAVMPKNGTREAMLTKLEQVSKRLTTNLPARNNIGSGSGNNRKSSALVGGANNASKPSKVPTKKTAKPDWREKVMLKQFLDYLKANEEHPMIAARKLTFEKMGASGGKDSAYADHYKFNFTTDKGERKNYHLGVISTDPRRLKNRPKPDKYSITSGFHQKTGGGKGAAGTRTSTLMRTLYEDGLFGTLPDPGKGKPVYDKFHELIRRSDIILHDLDNTELEVDALGLPTPALPFITDLSPFEHKKAVGEITNHLANGRGLDPQRLTAAFESGQLILAKKHIKKADGEYFSLSMIAAQFHDLSDGGSMCSPAKPGEQAFTSGGAQMVCYKPANPEKGVLAKTLTGTLDHATAGLNGICYGTPKPGSDFAWFAEGLYDSIAFNELQQTMQYYDANLPFSLPFVEDNCLSVKNVNGIQVNVGNALNIEWVGDTGDFRLKEPEAKTVPLTDADKDIFKKWFTHTKVHWVNDGSDESITLAKQLETLMRQSGMDDDEITACVVSHSSIGQPSMSKVTDQLFRKGGPMSKLDVRQQGDETVVIEPVMLNKGNIHQWLKQSGVGFTSNDQGQLVPHVILPKQASGPPFSQLPEQEQVNLANALKTRFTQVFGARGIGVALDADEGGIFNEVHIHGFAKLIGIPYQTMMPPIVKKYPDPISGGTVALKDPNDILKQLRKVERTFGEGNEHAVAILKHYASCITPPENSGETLKHKSEHIQEPGDGRKR